MQLYPAHNLHFEVIFEPLSMHSPFWSLLFPKFNLPFSLRVCNPTPVLISLPCTHHNGSRFTPSTTIMPGVTTASALTSSIHYQPFRYPPPSPPSNCSEEIDDLASSYLAITEFLLKESSDSGESHSKNNTCSQQQPPIKKPVCCNKQDQATRDDLDGKVAMSTTKCSNER